MFSGTTSSGRVALPALSSTKASALRPTSTRCVKQRVALGPQREPVHSFRVIDSPQRRSTVSCQSSASGPAEPVEIKTVETGKEKKENILVLGFLFAGWYGANTFFNIANKTVLKNVPLPFTFTTLQFAVGGALALLMWTFNLHEKPKVSKDTVLAILPLAAVHTLGNLLTNVSLGKVAVSFTHTIKSMEPFFSVLLSSLFLGDTPSPAVLATLVPIVGGVVAASASEATFNWGGFLAAMGSNLTFQSRNVFSKKFMGNKKGSLDNINLFSIITIMSFFLLAPFSLLREGFQLGRGGLTALGVVDPNFIYQQAVYAALSFHTYQQVSYMILQRVSPVTHSIGNCLKRVIVIVASVIFFKNPVSQQNVIGTSIALAGVFAYSQVKRSANKKAVAVVPAKDAPGKEL